VTLAVLAGGAAAWSVLGAIPVGASALSGAAEITVPGQSNPLRSGGSATPYGVALPPGASCPGDTAHHGYHVFSYLVPLGTSPATVRFSNIPDTGLGYFGTGGVYVGPLNTAEYTGQIVGLPTSLTLTHLSPRLLFAAGRASATWDGGIACATAKGAVAAYWNTRIVFTRSSTDPGGFTWSIPTPGRVVGASHGYGLWLAIALIVLAVLLSGAALAFRRRPATGGSRVER
jgi:hypothetical protein